MRAITLIAAAAAFVAPFAGTAEVKPAPTPAGQDHAVYQPRYHDPVLKEMEDANKERVKKEEAATDEIRAGQKTRDETENKVERVLRFDMSKVLKPAGPAAFHPAWHQPPQAQYNTNTCWSFSTTAFYESEVFRLTGQKVRLSEVWTVYWEHVERVRRFVRERGDSAIAEGSESNAVARIWKSYGIVPYDAYPGLRDNKGRLDHSRLIGRLRSLTDWVKANDVWDEDLVIAMARTILDREIGVPPATVAWQGATITPQAYLSQVLKLKLDDYVEMMSQLSSPFFQQAEYKVPDNWWHDASYYNVPLADWYAGIVNAVRKGMTVGIGGDVSEPGINGFEDAAIIPDFDIPQHLINQDSREFRFNNHTSEDDHGLHLVGMTTTADGHDWFLIKDSGRSSRWGKFEGYYFYRDDFVRLKMLTYTIHKDAVRDVLAKFKK